MGHQGRASGHAASNWMAKDQRGGPADVFLPPKFRLPSSKLTYSYPIGPFIVALPIKIVMFHSYVNVHQRV